VEVFCLKFDHVNKDGNNGRISGMVGAMETDVRISGISTSVLMIALGFNLGLLSS
jgi:hypothetical protein